MISHHGVLYPLEKLAKEKIKLSYVKLDKNGLVSFSDLEKLLKNNSRTFVSIMHANNEVGVIQDIMKIGLICKIIMLYFILIQCKQSDTIT